MSGPQSPYAGGDAQRAYSYPDRANVKMSEALRVLDEGVHPLVIHSSQILAVALLITAVINHLPKITHADLIELWHSLQIDVAYAFLLTIVAVFLFTYYALRHPRPVYLIDFATWQLPKRDDDGSLHATAKFFRETVSQCGNFDDGSVEFQMKLFERNQISEHCYFPPGIREYRKGECPFDFSMEAARKEFETVVFSTCDELFARTGVKPTDVRARLPSSRSTAAASPPPGTCCARDRSHAPAPRRTRLAPRAHRLTSWWSTARCSTRRPRSLRS
jgi:3-ketoacyl-CoA synthase